MYVLHTVSIILLSVLVWAPSVTAQDSALATVVSRDGATKLVLTGDHVAFLFTEQGARVIERDLISSPSQRDTTWMDRVIATSVSGGVRGMRMIFPLEDVREARYADGVLTLYMESRPLDAAETDQRGKFVYEDVETEEAHAFIRVFERIKTGR